jgi:deazaflavin-dependent oxidoreductase (nitroreductase family)
MWGRFKRWLYRDGRPSVLTRWINAGVAALHAAGVGPASWVTLEVVGRRSGRPIAFPLVMPTLSGERFLVSMLGDDAAWVRNLRAAGGAATLRRRRATRVQLEEVPAAERAPILRAYLRLAPGARPHLPVDPNAPLERFAAIAEHFPVFRVRHEANGFPGSDDSLRRS